MENSWTELCPETSEVSGGARKHTKENAMHETRTPTTNAEVLDRVRKILSKGLNIPIDNIRPDSKIGMDLEMGKDAIEVEALRQKLENDFGISLPDPPECDEEYDRLLKSTVQDLANFVAELIPPPQ